MKNTLRIVGIIAFAAIIGFGIVSCEPVKEQEDFLDGTKWKIVYETNQYYISEHITFEKKSWTQTFTQTDGTSKFKARGTYTVFEGTGTLLTEGAGEIGGKMTAVVSDNTLTLTSYGGYVYTYTKDE